MMRSTMILAAGLALSGCATVQNVMPGGGEPAHDTALLAIENARVRSCPAGRSLDNARIGSDNQSIGVTSQDIALTPLASDPTRAVRMRRLTIAPGGVIAWHAHDSVQGMALIVSGRLTELRNSCLDEIRYVAGDVAIEDANTQHGWRNESDEEAVVLVAHVVVR